MSDTVAFLLKRHENILSSLAGYLSGHTEHINDFSEGSITRSLLEGLSQEIYRQNITYAQGIAEAIRTSMKQAFNQPLLESQKASGQFTAYRSMLPAPGSVTLSYENTGASLTGTVSATGLLTVASIATGAIVIGQGITGGTLPAGTYIQSFVTGTGGTSGLGTYQLASSSSISAIASTTSFTTFGLFGAPSGLIVTSTTAGNIPVSSSGSYYYSILAQYNSSYVSVASSPIQIQFASAQNVSLSWAAKSGATGYYIYRSDSPYMLNASRITISSGATTTYTDNNTGLTSAKWPGIVYTFGVSATNLTNGTLVEGPALGVSGSPTANTTNVSWSPVSSGDVASTPTGYYVYQSNYNVNLDYPEYANVSLSSGGTLNYGSYFYISSIVGTTMTVASITSGAPTAGQLLSGNWVLGGTKITSQLTGTAGSTGTYQINLSQTLPATSYTAYIGTSSNNGNTITAASNIMTVHGGVVGTLVAGQTITGTNVAAGTTIVNQISGTTGGLGTYTVSISQSTTSTTITSLYGILSSLSYYYSVTALSSVSESRPSPPISTAVNSTYRTVNLTWPATTGAVGYRVYRDTSVNFTSPVSYDVTTNALTDTGSNITAASTYPTTNRIATISVGATNTFKTANVPGSSASWPSTGLAFSVQGAITIPSGTQVSVPNTGKIYQFPVGVTMSAGAESVTGIVESLTYGAIGNSSANSITNFVTPVYGISSGTNFQPFINGSDIETEEQWKTRFIASLKDLGRGTLESIQFGALSVKLFDNNGFIYEQVTRSIAVEPSSQVVSVYIHNGSSTSSSADLVQETQKIINGYTNNQGIRQAGYKPAGIPVTVYAALTQRQDVYVELNIMQNFAFSIIQENVTNSIKQYFADMYISDGFKVPSITSVTALSPTGSQLYKYRIVAIDYLGNKSLPSATVEITNGNVSPYNTLVWSVDGSGPTISFYEILRWDGTNWGLVTTVATTSSSTITYTDSSSLLSQYSFVNPVVKYFQKSDLIKMIMRTPGVLSASLTVPDINAVDQNVIVPSRGTILVPGNIYFK